MKFTNNANSSGPLTAAICNKHLRENRAELEKEGTIELQGETELKCIFEGECEDK